MNEHHVGMYTISSCEHHANMNTAAPCDVHQRFQKIASLMIN